VVHSVDELWHRKYAEAPDGRPAPVIAGASDGHAVEGPDDPPAHAERHPIHMPSPSYWPIVTAAGLPILAYGILYSKILIADGVLLLLTGLYSWAIEPSAEEAVEHAEAGGHG
jgi:cytochrome c oxidase subunit I